MVQSQVTQCKLTHIMIIAPGPAHCVMWASFHRISRVSVISLILQYKLLKNHFLCYEFTLCVTKNSTESANL